MPSVRKLVGYGGAIVLALLVFAGGWITGRLGIGSVGHPASLSELERQFAERMHRSSMVGYFTVTGHEDRPLRPDRYDLSSVEKIGENLWRFNASMPDSSNVTIPIAVPMQWIGDTPVIMMTDTSIPGIGTFTCRVFFYGNLYAGTWQHGSVGGHLFGRIEKQPGE